MKTFLKKFRATLLVSIVSLVSLARLGGNAMALLNDSAPPDCKINPSKCLNAVITPTNSGFADKNIYELSTTIINAALSFIGIIALAYIIYGGYLWMTAGGNEEKVEKSKEILIAASIGMAIVLAALAIVNFVVKIFV